MITLLVFLWSTSRIFAQSQGEIWLWKKTNKLEISSGGFWTHSQFSPNQQLLSQQGMRGGFSLGYGFDCDGQLSYLYNDSTHVLLNRNLQPFHNSAYWLGRNIQHVTWPGTKDSIIVFGSMFVNLVTSSVEYIVIDKSLQGGLGSIVVPPNRISQNHTLNYTIVRHHQPNKYWLVTFEHPSKMLKTYLIDSTGVNLNCSDSIYLDNNFAFNHEVHLISSADGTYFSLIQLSNSIVWLLRFDNNRGRLYDKIKLRTPGFNQGLAGTIRLFFSLNNKFIYTSGYYNQKNIYQWPIDSWDSLTICNSGIAIDSGLDFSGNTYYCGLSPGPDGHMYLLRRSNTQQRYFFDRIRYIDSLYNPAHRDSAFYVLPPDPNELQTIGYLPFSAPYKFAPDRFSIYAEDTGCVNQVHPFQLRDEENLNQVSWLTGDSVGSLAVTQVGKRIYPVYTRPGRYTVSAFAEYCNHFDTLTFVVHILGEPDKPAVVDTVFCGLANVYFSLSPAYTYRWSDGDSATIKSFGNPGTYWLETSNACFTRRDSFSIREQFPPQHGLPADTTFCAGDQLTLAPAPGDFRWYWNDGDTLPKVVSAPGTFILLMENSCGTFPFSIGVLERQIPQPFLPPDTTICEGQILRVELEADVRRTFAWSDGSAERIRLLSEAGAYMATVTNECGDGSVNMTLQTEDCTCNLYIPTAFSPNGDGLNDQFEIKTRCNLLDYTLQVYNRWGELLFESRSLASNWDGNYQGEPLPAGNYVYQIRYHREGLGPRQASGGFRLLR